MSSSSSSSPPSVDITEKKNKKKSTQKNSTNINNEITTPLQDSPPPPPSSSSTTTTTTPSLNNSTSSSVFQKSLVNPPPFANMMSCENCRIEVGGLLSSTRHHCRNCGGSFCASCSTQSIRVPFQEYLKKGALRVCDSCFQKINEFYSQVGRQQGVTWLGLEPFNNDLFRREFLLPPAQTPVVIYSCCYFPDHVPMFGHLYLTHQIMCFRVGNLEQ